MRYATLTRSSWLRSPRRLRAASRIYVHAPSRGGRETGTGMPPLLNTRVDHAKTPTRFCWYGARSLGTCSVCITICGSLASGTRMWGTPHRLLGGEASQSAWAEPQAPPAAATHLPERPIPGDGRDLGGFASCGSSPLIGCRSARVWPPDGPRWTTTGGTCSGEGQSQAGHRNRAGRNHCKPGAMTQSRPHVRGQEIAGAPRADNHHTNKLQANRSARASVMHAAVPQ
eukprot:8195-Chlamydomonas_euryale.AAC.5